MGGSLHPIFAFVEKRQQRFFGGGEGEEREGGGRKDLRVVVALRGRGKTSIESSPKCKEILDSALFVAGKMPQKINVHTKITFKFGTFVVQYYSTVV